MSSEAGLAAIVACAFASCGNDSARNDPNDSPILATVAGTTITQADLEAEIAHRQKQRRPIPAKEQLLAEMIERRALLHRAREAGLESEVAVRRDLDNLLIAALRQRELENKLRKIEISEEELKAAYESRIAEFTRPAKVRIALLQLKAGKRASAEKRAEVLARIQDARDRIIANPAPGGRGPAARGFGALAINYSEDQASRYRGGDIGWLNDGSFEYPLPRQVLETAYRSDLNTVSEILEVDGSFYLVMKTDSREAVTQSFEEAKPVLRVGLARDRREQLQNSFREETNRIAGTTIDKAALAALNLPASANSSPQPAPELRPPALPAGN